MERRKVLLGSGVGLATALAGCASDGFTSSDDANDENNDGDSENHGSNDPGAGDGKGNDGKSDKKNENGEKNAGNRDIPGVDVDAFESLLEEQGIHLETLRHSGPNLTINVSIADLNWDQFDGSSRDELEERFMDVARAAANAVTDAQAFIASVETVTVSILNDDARKGKEKTGLSLEVSVAWLLEFARGHRSQDDVLDQVAELDAEDEY